jgi:Flp pilus assembly protein TadG
MRSRRTQLPRRGAAAVEFALVLPLLIALCLTSIDFGRFAYAYIALENAARVGGEYAATHSYSSGNAGSWRQKVEASITEDFGTSGGLDSSRLNTEIEVDSDDYGLQRITIDVRYPFATVVQWPGIPRPLDLQRSITFRRFR